MIDWDTYFLGLAFYVSVKSKDPSTKCGCILIGDKHQVVSTGYNGLPRGLDDDVEDRKERPAKYHWFEHAERNAIYNASLNGLVTKGCTAYITAPPCSDCARAIVQSGIIKIVTPTPHSLSSKEASSRWRESLEVSKEMLKEANIIWKIFPLTSVLSPLTEASNIVTFLENSHGNSHGNCREQAT